MGQCKFHREQGCLGQLLLLIKGTWRVHRGESQKNLAASCLQKCLPLSQVQSRRTNPRHSRKLEDRIILNFQVNMSLRSENVFSWVSSFAIQYYDCNSCSLELIGFSTSLKLFLLPHSLQFQNFQVLGRCMLSLQHPKSAHTGCFCNATQWALSQAAF